MPPGTSIVTPTRPPISVASARVKPTTPNLLAQYAVASRQRAQSQRGGDGDDAPAGALEVRQRGADHRRGAEQVDQHDAIPGLAVDVQESPQASVPAAVTTPSRPPCSSATARTAASAARASARSTS